LGGGRKIAAFFVYVGSGFSRIERTITAELAEHAENSIGSSYVMSGSGTWCQVVVRGVRL